MYSMLNSFWNLLNYHTRIKLVLATQALKNNQLKLKENISSKVQENRSDIGQMRPG